MMTITEDPGTTGSAGMNNVDRGLGRVARQASCDIDRKPQYRSVKKETQYRMGENGLSHGTRHDEHIRGLQSRGDAEPKIQKSQYLGAASSSGQRNARCCLDEL